MAGKDKQKHFLISLAFAVIVSLLAMFLHPFWVGTITSIMIGIGKEYMDECVYKTGADELDLLADLFGVMVGMLLLHVITNLIGL